MRVLWAIVLISATASGYIHWQKIAGMIWHSGTGAVISAEEYNEANHQDNAPARKPDRNIYNQR
jgi:hypothetical protein